MTNILNIVNGVLICAACNGPMKPTGAYSETLVGYEGAPAGHDHNDNCKGYVYKCASNHFETVYLRRSCPACDWRGKTACFCHPGTNVAILPKAQ